MADPVTSIGTAVGLFVGTNPDDVVVLAVRFLACRASCRPKAWEIWAGQYLGIAALVVVSGIAAAGLSIVPERWVALLGLVPLVLGVWGLVSAIRSRGTEDEQ